MSDNYITITTSREVSEPIELKNKVIEFLQSKEYVERELSDCVLNMKNKGYRPGKNHVSAIGYDEDLLSLNVCGLEFKTQREVMNAGAFTAMTKMECPNCNKNRFEGITPQDFFTDNCTKEQLELFHSVFPQFDSWTNGYEAKLKCPHCLTESKIENYKTDNSISFSNFGLTFWNWSDLTNEFIEELKTVIRTDIIRINGHI